MVPKGFFDDRQADAAAQGEKVRTRKDKEADFVAFQLEMEAEVARQEEAEAREAEAATARKDAEEAFEVRWEGVKG